MKDISCGGMLIEHSETSIYGTLACNVVGAESERIPE